MDDVAVFDRLTAATVATHLTLMKPGDVVTEISEAISDPIASRRCKSNSIVIFAASRCRRMLTPVQIELFPVANRFCRGHRLRLEISSSQFPLFDVNPNSGESAGSLQHPCIANNRVFVDVGRQSQVVPPASRSCDDLALTELRALDGDSFLHGGARQHAPAMPHDAWQFAGVDPIALEPGSDREQIGVANRVVLAHDPGPLEVFVLDEVEAFGHCRRDFALHGLDRRGIIRPPRAAPAMRVGDVYGRAQITIELLDLGEREGIR